MNGALLFGLVIAVVSIWGAAYLLSVWHEDRADMISKGESVTLLRTWPFSRVLAYVAIACMLASNYLTWPTTLRLIEFPNYREIQTALTPFTLTALLVLDVAFVVIALYLRVIRGRGVRVP